MHPTNSAAERRLRGMRDFVDVEFRPQQLHPLTIASGGDAALEDPISHHSYNKKRTKHTLKIM
jgi:hypothetical protein